MILTNKEIFWIMMGVSLVVFFLGWVFPVEGPLDYLYDKWATQPAINQPKEHKMQCCPAPAPKVTKIYEDLNEDGEPEWYEVVPLFNIIEE